MESLWLSAEVLEHQSILARTALFFNTDFLANLLCLLQSASAPRKFIRQHKATHMVAGFERSIMQPFRRTLVKLPNMESLCRVIPDYEVMLVTILDAMLDRFDRRPDYPFIDTKLNLITGEDFAEAGDPERDFKGPTAIFSWIQGRGLESLVDHARWLERCSVLSQQERDERGIRLKGMVEAVFDRMEWIRSRNHGRLFFTMTPEGVPFDMDESGRRRRIRLAAQGSNFSDLFYAKGMLAAAHFLAQDDKIAQARRWFRTILGDVEADRFRPDQISFDPRNPLETIPGRRSHGARMISIGACAQFGELLKEEEWLAGGERLITYLMDHYVSMRGEGGLEPYDYYEAIDAAGNPWRDEEGRVLSDPGHALEYVGLAAKLLLLRDRGNIRSPESELLKKCTAMLPKVFTRNFRNGYNEKIGGICKAFDLVSRRPINDHMPWWNLPETMRAAAELLVLLPGCTEESEILEALMRCSNGFMSRFVNADVHLMAYQTVDAHGKPVEVVPATPDADPGYHTGLSVIDMMDCLSRLTGGCAAD